jgi:hypothetical protein
MIQISNCPDTGLVRKVVKKDLYKLETCRQVILRCLITHFKDGVAVENGRIHSYSKDLVASDSLVNPSTGVLLTPEQLSDIENLGFTPIQEYSFFHNLTLMPVVMNDLENSIILSRDAQGKFDI